MHAKMNKTYNKTPNTAGFILKIAKIMEKSRKNCKNRTKIAKNARKRRQIVENGVDQIDLGGVGKNPETKKRKMGGAIDFQTRKTARKLVN
jgi:hypothetical protein